MISRRQMLASGAALLASGIPDRATAQSNYPDRPIRLIIGFAAGGPTDVIGRIVAQDMSATLGQSVVVENRTGANAQVATEAVARADADGYTLLCTSLSHVVNFLIVPNVKYHPLNDFVPIGNAAVTPLVIVTAAGSSYNTLQELIAAAKQKPGELLYGSAGNGGSAHLAAAMLARAADVKMGHVPFRGNAPALTEVLAGRISFMFYPMIGIADYVADNKLKVLASGTKQRQADFPNVPTMAEAGLSGFEDTAPWIGMFAPAKTPAPIVQKLTGALQQSLRKPETMERIKKLGGNVVGSSSSEFRAFLEQDIERWDRVIKASGIKAE
ncbi:tripartite tricarboxylate transporter substrate binding protein [Bradyrhizobium sp. LHD-71]|uniref:Bug family tripartite tricarboxylate transporter substrate binding protein n=1 Tax=Bradyrhizobium sp. LHD-71 TaxID=3072141 RepID=UPI00280FA3DC|nr:tripartite tricarboxylate transporter substrate binding protein [Bradyrhizobium sp. LHD-71]MDQ8729334.1 tripartite tricarboxylate transporter substrate binding protein [Bradyrhizobium sp. LHD-71]